jgi:hypothetical protein
MKKSEILILFITFLSISVFGQEEQLAPKIGLPLVSQVNQGNSYITFPTDIGNIEPLWFEGNVIPNFNLRKSHNSRLMGVLTPQIIIRMYQEESFPVRTPSYMPQITVYYRLTDFEKERSLNLYGRIAHHSNGQDGNFFLEDSKLNLKAGSFATNFLELGLITTNVNVRFNAYQFFKTSFEVHPEGFIQEELLGIYSRYRWHNTLSIFKLVPDYTQSNSNKPTISLKGETTWMFGNYNNLNVISAKRLNLSLTFYYHPKFLEDIGFFVQYYHGSDYYNMYFDHRIDVLRFGFMTERLNF